MQAFDGTTLAPHVSALYVYPVKGLDGVAVPVLHLAPGGRPAHDREWALLDATGRYVNGKRCPAVHAVRLISFEPPSTVTFACVALGSATFDLAADAGPAGVWLTRALAAGGADGVARHGLRVVRADPAEDASFADDPRFAGPVVVSAASLRAVGGWFGFSADEAAARFRPNVVVDGVPAWWEDGLLDDHGTHGAAVALGGAACVAALPIHRCVVPSRAPVGGAATPGFAAAFQSHRVAALPLWAPRARLTGAPEPHAAYFLGVGLVTAGGGGGGGGAPARIAAGDPVAVGALADLQAVARARSPTLSPAAARLLLSRGFAIGRVSLSVRTAVGALLAALPTALGAAVVAGSQPQCVRKPTASEVRRAALTCGAAAAVVAAGLVLCARRWLGL